MAAPSLAPEAATRRLLEVLFHREDEDTASASAPADSSYEEICFNAQQQQQDDSQQRQLQQMVQNYYSKQRDQSGVVMTGSSDNVNMPTCDPWTRTTSSSSWCPQSLPRTSTLKFALPSAAEAPVTSNTRSALRRRSNSDPSLNRSLSADSELELCSDRPGVAAVSPVPAASPEEGCYRVYDDLDRIREWNLIPYVLTRRMRRAELESKVVVVTTEEETCAADKDTSRVSVDSGRASVVSSSLSYSSQHAVNTSQTSDSGVRAERALSVSGGSNCSADSGLEDQQQQQTQQQPPPQLQQLRKAALPNDTSNHVQLAPFEVNGTVLYDRPAARSPPQSSSPPPLPPRTRTTAAPRASPKRKDLSSYFGLFQDADAMQRLSALERSPRAKKDLQLYLGAEDEDDVSLDCASGVASSIIKRIVSPSKVAAKQQQQRKPEMQQPLPVRKQDPGPQAVPISTQQYKTQSRQPQSLNDLHRRLQQHQPVDKHRVPLHQRHQHQTDPRFYSAQLSLPHRPQPILPHSPPSSSQPTMRLVPQQQQQQQQQVQRLIDEPMPAAEHPHHDQAGSRRRLFATDTAEPGLTRSMAVQTSAVNIVPAAKEESSATTTTTPGTFFRKNTLFARSRRRRSEALTSSLATPLTSRATPTPGVSEWASAEDVTTAAMPKSRRRSFMASLLLSTGKKSRMGGSVNNNNNLDDASSTASSCSLSAAKSDFSMEVREARRQGLPVIPFLQTPTAQRRQQQPLAISPNYSGLPNCCENSRHAPQQRQRQTIKAPAARECGAKPATTATATSPLCAYSSLPAIAVLDDCKENNALRQQTSEVYLTMAALATPLRVGVTSAPRHCMSCTCQQRTTSAAVGSSHFRARTASFGKQVELEYVAMENKHHLL